MRVYVLVGVDDSIEDTITKIISLLAAFYRLKIIIKYWAYTFWSCSVEEWISTVLKGPLP